MSTPTSNNKRITICEAWVQKLPVSLLRDPDPEMPVQIEYIRKVGSKYEVNRDTLCDWNYEVEVIDVPEDSER